MSQERAPMRLKDRHLYGAGAAACAVCCAAPLVGLIGLAGAAATAFAFAFAGLVFAVVVGGAALAVTLGRRRTERRRARPATDVGPVGPVDVIIGRSSGT